MSHLLFPASVWKDILFKQNFTEGAPPQQDGCQLGRTILGEFYSHLKCTHLLPPTSSISASSTHEILGSMRGSSR
jgi:hypothetical protein